LLNVLDSKLSLCPLAYDERQAPNIEDRREDQDFLGTLKLCECAQNLLCILINNIYLPRKQDSDVDMVDEIVVLDLELTPEYYVFRVNISSEAPAPVHVKHDAD
jgi:hypothetical protein